MFELDKILGINRRYLDYVKKLNPKKQIRIVDRKQKTKQFLSVRGIPFAETYDFIKTKKEIINYDFNKIKNEEFVIKPNRGSGGKGILIVKKIKFEYTNTINQEILDKKNIENKINKNFFIRIKEKIVNNFFDKKNIEQNKYKISGKIFTEKKLKNELLNIIEGKYTLGEHPTEVIIEEKLNPGSGFEKLCEYGLADIRIIVCNLIPVASMIRVPVPRSEGKANLAQGGIGLGVDISSGIVKTLALNVKGLFPKFYDNEFPQEYKKFENLKIPFREDLLLYSSNIQYFINLGFIGVDRVITDKGPKLLEVNGRAGLEIQNISRVPLQQVLNKIKDLNITSPNKGVEIAQSLFSTQKESGIPKSKIIFLTQKGVLSYEDDNGTKKEIDIIIEVDTKKKRSYTSQKIFSKINGSDNINIKFSGKGTSIKNINFLLSENLKGYKIKLGTNILNDFYIKPIHKSHPSTKFVNTSHIIEEEIESIQILDEKLYEISRKLNLSKYLNPTNYLDEFDKFVSNNGKYNPNFQYCFPTKNEIIETETKLKKLNDEHQGGQLLKSNFAKLFYNKIEELNIKLNLINAYKKQDFDKIGKYNKILFGEIEKDKIYLSQEKLKDIKTGKDKMLGKIIPMQQIRKEINKFLQYNGLKNIPIKYSTTMLSRISILGGSKPQILLYPNIIRREHELQGQLIHELGIHLKRLLSGRRTGRLLLEKGTGFYSTDEEGIAIYKAKEYISNIIPNYENINIYKKYIFLEEAKNKDFKTLCEYIKDYGEKLGENRTLRGIFAAGLKIHRGIKNTSEINKGKIYMKDKIYLDGYLKIKNFVENGGDINKLMIGKIKIDDINFIF